MLLREQLTYQQAHLVMERAEDTTGKNLYMKGVFIQGGVRNLNERVYPVNEITKAVESINEQVRNNQSILGEADHPEELNINLDRVSHMVTEMWMDGPCGMGKLKILPTPMGNIITTLLESGVKLGVSSRGSGNVNESGLVSDFEIITIDIVARPSAQTAYPQPVYEAVLNHRRAALFEDLARSAIHDPKAQRYLKKGLLDMINNFKA